MTTQTQHREVYPPLDTLKPVAEGVFLVDSGPLYAAGIPVPVRMTVVRLSSGEVWLHSPTRHTPALRSELERLGPIAHLVAPNVAHWSYVKDWQRHLPRATTWAAPGLRDRLPVRLSGVRLDHDLGPEPPPAWAADLDQLVIPGGLGVSEVAFLHRATRTLILTDLIENFEADKLNPFLRPLVAAVGALAPDGMAPAHYRIALNLNRSEVRAAAQRLLDWQPERVLFAHGAWFDHDAPARLRHALRWVLG